MKLLGITRICWPLLQATSLQVSTFLFIVASSKQAPIECALRLKLQRNMYFIGDLLTLLNVHLT